MLTQARADELADRRRDAWNAHDPDRFLAHYADDVGFHSPFVVALTGTGADRAVTAGPSRPRAHRAGV